MKTPTQTPKYMAAAFAALALAGLIALPISASAQGQGAGAAKLIKNASIQASQNAPAVAAGKKPTNLASKSRPGSVGMTSKASAQSCDECCCCCCEDQSCCIVDLGSRRVTQFAKR